MIPSIIHFIHIFDRPFSLLNHVAIAAARHHHPDWKILLHHEEVRGSAESLRWWYRTADLCESVKADIPLELEGEMVEWAQHRSDLVRLQLLADPGGFYLDMDLVLLKSLDPLRGFRGVVSGEDYLNETMRGSRSTELDDLRSISSAALAFVPDSRFIRDWIDSLPSHYGRSWAGHAVDLPLELLKTGAYQDEVELLPPEAFNPFSFNDSWILQSDQHHRLAGSYGIHLFETIGRDRYLRDISEEWVRRSDATIATLLRPYLDAPDRSERMRSTRRKQLPRICLNMIVRDEAHIIAESLSSVAHLIDYWVIVDTGSVDSTIEVVREFFRERDIPGEIHEQPWRDFGSNRSEALALCRDKAEYVLVLDADDVLHGDLDLSALSEDSYLLRIGSDFMYWRKQLFSNCLNWRYEGVLHEYPVCDDGFASSARIEGDYYIESRRLGGRNLTPDKYARDAEVLRKAHADEPDNQRTVFYLAQSCYDAGLLEEALKHYSRRIEMGGWEEEIYYSHFKRAACMHRLGRSWPEVEDAYLEAWRSRTSRAEPLYEIARQLRIDGRYDRSYIFGKLASEIPFPEEDNLFVDSTVYSWRARDERAIAAFYLGKYRESFDLCVELLENPTVPEEARERILANRDFSVPHVRDDFASHPVEIIERLNSRKRRAKKPRITLTVTTCRRLDLFERTINSFLNCCMDAESIRRWICIDDGSSAADRKRMKETYPFFEFVFKTRKEKGHAKSMNRLLEMIDSPYWLHLEDDWQFFVRDRYVGKAIEVLADDPSIGQVHFNRNYAETTDCRKIVGGVVRQTKKGQRYRVHTHFSPGSPELDNVVQSLFPGTLTVAYWPHYSLRPSLTRMRAIRRVGRFEPRAEHFELEFADRYADAGFVTAFLDSINALHIGPLTTDSGSQRGPNAYDLNDEPQFGQKRSI